MSRNAKIYPANKKPYCKVCFDAGKPESEYTSHWVRSLPDRNGKTSVLCPTLLATECRFCYELGHTAKFCPVLEKNKKDRERADRKYQASASEKTNQKAPEPKKPASIFDALREDSSDSEDERKVSIKSNPVENFPVLGGTTKRVQITLPKTEPEVKTGWAAIAAKPKEDPFMKKVEELSIMKSLPQSALKPKPEVVPLPSIGRDYTKPIYTKSWADWTDSDSDEDEDEMPSENPVLKRETMPIGWSTNFSMEDDDW
jgi:hypothetical protein